MEINIKIAFRDKETRELLCFKHAVQEAIKGIDIETEAFDADRDYIYDISQDCIKC